MKRWRRWLFPALLLNVAAPACLCAEHGIALNQHIRWAAGYLSEAVTVSGRFVYLRDLQGSAGDPRRYNVLRHAGALYAMASYPVIEPPDGGFTEAIKRTAAYLVGCCVGPVDGRTGLLALWSPPERAGSRHAYLQAKLGGTGLALAALVQVEFVQPGTTAPEMLAQLAHFIVFMQKPDGSFYSKYIPSRGERSDEWISLYYPGEAALGLIMLHELSGDSRWLAAAIDALRYLARTREGRGPLPADHWALIATARLLKQNPEALREASPTFIPWSEKAHPLSIKGTLRDHAEALVENILAEQIEGHERRCLNGGFSPDGRVTPTATRLEGLLSALSFLPEGALRDRVLRAVNIGIRFLVEAQIKNGPTQGAFTRSSPLCTSPDARANEIRIDYVQHALSAMIAYRGLVESARLLMP